MALRLLVVIGILLVVNPRIVRGQQVQSDDKLTAAIDKAVKKIGIDDEEPGVAVLIYQPGRLL